MFSTICWSQFTVLLHKVLQFSPLVTAIREQLDITARILELFSELEVTDDDNYVRIRKNRNNISWSSVF